MFRVNENRYRVLKNEKECMIIHDSLHGRYIVMDGDIRIWEVVDGKIKTIGVIE